MNDKVRGFLESNHTAAMTTLRRDGTPHSVRIGVALVDGKLWSSGTQARVRTTHLRRDPRCNVFVMEEGGFGYLALETEVHILDGADAPTQNHRLFQVMQNIGPDDQITWYGQKRTPEEFLRTMAEEQRLIYEFEIKRAYGMY